MAATFRMFIPCAAALWISGAQAVDKDDEPDSALREIIITATRQPRRISDEPTRVEVIDPEEIDEKVLMSPDVAMLLNETSGLRVQTTSPGLGAADIRIEGLRGRYTQVLADGLPLYGGQTGGTGLLQIPPLDLRQVEVLKGVSSALYGGSALGGVINFVSRRPDRIQEAILNQTSRGGTDAAFWWAGEPAAQGWSYSVLASANRQARQDVNGDGWADMPSYRRAVIRPRIYWAGEAGREVMITAGATLEDRAGGTVAGGVVPVGDPNGSAFVEALKTERFDVGLSARWPVADDRILTVRASATSRDLHQTFGDIPEPSQSDTAFAEIALNGTSGVHHWVIGAGVEHDRYRDQMTPGFNYTYDVPGLFVQDEIAMGDAVTLSASGRVDHHSGYGTFFSPRLATLWKPGGPESPWRVRVSLGTGFYAPTPITEDTEATGLARVMPNSSLAAERAWGMSFDVNRSWRLEHGSIETNATVFSSELNHAVSFIPATGMPDRFTFANNTAPTRNLGTELLARWRTGPFTVLGTYAYLNATELPPNAVVRQAVPLNPRHAANLTATWEKKELAKIGVECFFIGQQALIDNPYRSASPGYVMFGLLLQRQLGSASVLLNAENLTDRRLTRFDPLVLSTRAADGRWTTDAWAPLDGRVINLGVRWRFGGTSANGEAESAH